MKEGMREAALRIHGKFYSFCNKLRLSVHLETFSFDDGSC